MSSTGLEDNVYFKIGTYQHDDNTVTPASFIYRPLRTPRGKRHATRVELHVIGELLADPTLATSLEKQDDLTTKMLAMEAAYHDDYQDLGFYRDDDDVTSLFLDTNASNSLTGNNLDYLNWTPGDGTEYCSRKSFRAGWSNVFLDDYSDIIFYQDTIKRIGTAGPIKSWRLNVFGPATPRQHTQFSTQKLIHVGRCFRITTFPSPPSPLAFGANYLEHLTEIQHIGPNDWGQVGGAYTHYGVTWKYFYEFPFHNPLAPT